MKRILVVGNEGYLGSRLTDYLQARGYLCAGADIGFFRDATLAAPGPVLALPKEARTITPDDICGFDVVIQLAGISNDPFGNLSTEKIYDPTRAYARRIAEFCKAKGVRYIFPSSCSVYGVGGGVLDEDGGTTPQTQYSVNKLQVEADLAALSAPAFSPIALRLATVFGASPRIRFDVIINMLCGMALSEGRLVLNSDGQAWRPHLYIDDACEAFRCCIEWEYDGGALLVLNVGRNDNNRKVLDVARLIQERVPGCTLEFLDQGAAAADELVQDRKIQGGKDTRTYQVSFDRIHNMLPGFEARWTVESGVDQLLADLRAAGLDTATFKRRDFYRLQQLEHLYASGRLTEDLRWN